MVRITYYLDVVSSWCKYVEPVWAQLGADFGDDLDQSWEVALIPPEALPKSSAEEDGYYRRSGIITRQSKMLHSGWFDPHLKEYLAPNCVAVACRELGYSGDGVRLAIADAAMVDGRKVGDFEESARIACEVCSLSFDTILETAKDSKVEEIVRASTKKFHSMGINQRPAFHLESEIEDRALFSGLIHKEPLYGTIRAMLDDVASYRSWSAHMT